MPTISFNPLPPKTKAKTIQRKHHHFVSPSMLAVERLQPPTILIQILFTHFFFSLVRVNTEPCTSREKCLYVVKVHFHTKFTSKVTQFQKLPNNWVGLQIGFLFLFFTSRVKKSFYYQNLGCFYDVGDIIYLFLTFNSLLYNISL